MWCTSYKSDDTGDEPSPSRFEHWEDARDCILELLSDLIWIYPDDANEAYESLKRTQRDQPWEGRVGRDTYDLYRSHTED